MKGRAALLTTGMILTAGLLAAGCGQGETEIPPVEDTAPAPIEAELEIAEVTLGKAVGADNAISNPTTSFQPGDTIYVAVRTEGTAPSATLAARWTYEDGQVVDESSQTIAPTGPEISEFHVSKPDGWPAGQYEVEISLDGAPAGAESFTVE